MSREPAYQLWTIKILSKPVEYTPSPCTESVFCVVLLLFGSLGVEIRVEIGGCMCKFFK